MRNPNLQKSLPGDEQQLESHPRLALNAREAAAALGISHRLLWEKTNSGEIPSVRIGRRVVYPWDVIRKWLEAEAARGRRQ